MPAETLEKAAELTVAALLGASCMVVGPVLRRLTARPVRVLITGAAGLARDQHIQEFLKEASRSSGVCIGSIDCQGRDVWTACASAATPL